MKRERDAADENSRAAGVASRTRFIAPCLATPASRPPAGPQWVTEIKYDGYRIQAHIAAGTVKLLTRSGHDWTGRLGRMRAEVAALPVSSAVIDGEAIVEDVRGRPDFHALQRELKRSESARIALMTFDLLWLDGSDMRQHPLGERKRALAYILGERPAHSLVRFSAHLEDEASEVMRRVCELGLEGIVCKRIDRPYRSGRSGDWIKVKCTVRETFVVGGYVPHKGVHEAVGSLALGYFRGDRLIYAGRVGTGFTAEKAHEIWRTLRAARQKRPPFATAPNREQSADAVWVEPRFAVDIEHRGWTHDDILRHSVFKAFHADVTASEVPPPASLRSSG